MKPTVKFTNVKCGTSNEGRVIIEQCRLYAISRTKTLLNITLDLLEPAKNLKLHWQMKIWGNGCKPWLAEYIIDFCAFLRKNNNIAVKVLYNTFKPFTNLNHTCPIEGKDMYWDPTDYKLPLPSGDYLVVLEWISDKKPHQCVFEFLTGSPFGLKRQTIQQFLIWV